ncbi:MAG: WbqC family protein [Prolixibacteraceae bacterium]|nr:WbqC family protein [Prolixibacteraceae bacterium]
MKLAVMQPYFFPYLGYFQLIRSVDKFIFYDDVNFIKNGWINRNQIVINNTKKYFTVQLKGASPNKLINEIEFTDNRHKLKSSIQLAYKKAPFYNDVWPIIEDCLMFKTEHIGILAIYSVKKVIEYLDIDIKLEISSENYSDTKGMDKAERLRAICKRNNASTYINPIGGQELYNKEDFKKEKIDLFFLNTKFTTYKQFNNEFISGLSILDIVMFNSKEDIYKMLDNYELI